VVRTRKPKIRGLIIGSSRGHKAVVDRLLFLFHPDLEASRRGNWDGRARIPTNPLLNVTIFPNLSLVEVIILSGSVDRRKPACGLYLPIGSGNGKATTFFPQGVVEVATLMDGSWGMGWPRVCYGLSQVETQVLIKQSVSL
jgi:hypothetical protein